MDRAAWRRRERTAASSSSGSVALGSRAGRESSDGAVDRGAAGFATLQADVVAAMAKAGQRGFAGMRATTQWRRSGSSNLAP